MTRRLIMAAAVLALCAGARADEWSQMIGQTDQVTQGLVAYWAMRTAGTQVLCERDCANGTASNGVTFAYADGVVGDGASFASNLTQYITMSNTLDMGTSSMTITAWARTSTAAAQHIAGKRVSGPGADGYGISITSSGRFVLSFGGAAATTYGTANTGPAVNNGQWQFVVGVWDRGGDMQAWVNGTNTATTSISAESGHNATNNEPFLIGAIRNTVGGISSPFNGQIDEVRVYMRPLGRDEILQLSRMGATPRRIRE
jgi:hypothetical protein